MSSNGKLFYKLNNLCQSRCAEIVFGTGLPLIGFILATSSLSELMQLFWFYPLILIAGCHVVIFNDLCFDASLSTIFSFRRPFRSVLILFVPLLLLSLLFIKPIIAILLLTVVLNWDIYSLIGKRNFLTVLMHNFIGGATHFLLGVVAILGTVPLEFIMPMLFFACSMTCAAIHHDSFDSEEDSLKGYVTGAVLFGADVWWKLAVIPMLLAGILLTLIPVLVVFIWCFGGVLCLYFGLYVYVTLRYHHPSMVLWFRTMCRVIFSCGALVFILIHIGEIVFYE